MSFSRSGILVAGDNLGDVGVWNASGWHLFARLAEGRQFQTYALSQDGRVLAAANLNGEIALRRLNLSNLSPGYFARLVCGAIRRNLTSAEWAQYAPGQPYQMTCPAYP